MIPDFTGEPLHSLMSVLELRRGEFRGVIGEMSRELNHFVE
ncbi:MAG TPA: hypothetical protein VII66_02640 [Gemmatimonadaceae bacterium]